jgi:hypothetical protein
MEKKEIIDYVEDLDANQLAQYILAGVVTLDELKQTGCLDHTKRIAIQQLLQEQEQRKRIEENMKKRQDLELWNQIKSSADVNVLEHWILNHANNAFIRDAEDRLNLLREELDRNREIKREILKNITINSNQYHVDDILQFIKSGVLSVNDLQDIGVPETVVKNLGAVRNHRLEIGDPPRELPEDTTEVYFWGYNGSGKTCALGAILQVAARKGLLNLLPGPGLRYGTQLHHIFSDDGEANDFLPGYTPFDKTQYIALSLSKSGERSKRLVSMVELSGEIFKCFFDRMSHAPFSNEQYEETFNTVNKYLNSNNRKIHFFFIDYTKNNGLDPLTGIRHSDYLSAAANYFEENRIFSKHTDAIYIVLTKSDLLVDEEGNRVPKNLWDEYAIRHLEGANYNAFKETLKKICKQYGINGGELNIEPFSLGEVYFKDICNFNGESAENILNILMSRIPREKKSWFSRLLNN